MPFDFGEEQDEVIDRESVRPIRPAGPSGGK